MISPVVIPLLWIYSGYDYNSVVTVSPIVVVRNPLLWVQSGYYYSPVAVISPVVVVGVPFLWPAVWL
jgi:hypothetical protein